MKLTDRNKKVIDILNRSLVEWYRTKSTTKPKPTTSGSNNEGMSIKRERFENAHHTTVSSLYGKVKLELTKGYVILDPYTVVNIKYGTPFTNTPFLIKLTYPPYTKMKTIQKSIETNLTKLFENGFEI